MPAVIIGEQENVYQVRAQWSGNGFGHGESSWSFIMSRAAGDQRALVFDRWMAYLAAGFVHGRASDWRLDRVLVEDRWPQTLAPLVVDVRLNADPVGEGERMPPQCSSLISWRTGVTGRAHRGRTFMGPYTAESMHGSFVTGPASYAVFLFAEAMMANFVGVSAVSLPVFAIVSRVGAIPGISPGAFTVVTGYAFLQQWAAVRRRLEFDWAT